MQVALTAPSSPVRPAARQAQLRQAPIDGYQKGLLERAGDRLKFAAGQGALGAGLAVASYTVPFATTAAISYLFPQWAPMGGVVGNLVVGAGVGMGVGCVLHDTFVGKPSNREEREERYNTMLHGAAFGAIGGFLGVVASPAATVNWPALGALSGTTVGVTAGCLAGWGFGEALWKGPRCER